MNQVRDLWVAGYREIVLTGIHLGQYGKDMHPRRHLHELLQGLLKYTASNRLRLSSIEPNEFTPRLLACIGVQSGLCPHFHVPLQSGSERILRGMGRRYTPAGYRDVIHRILDKSPDAAIGSGGTSRSRRIGRRDRAGGDTRAARRTAVRIDCRIRSRPPEESPGDHAAQQRPPAQRGRNGDYEAPRAGTHV